MPTEIGLIFLAFGVGFGRICKIGTNLYGSVGVRFFIALPKNRIGDWLEASTRDSLRNCFA
jgi:hypothetical protein